MKVLVGKPVFYCEEGILFIIKISGTEFVSRRRYLWTKYLSSRFFIDIITKSNYKRPDIQIKHLIFKAKHQLVSAIIPLTSFST